MCSVGTTIFVALRSTEPRPAGGMQRAICIRHDTDVTLGAPAPRCRARTAYVRVAARKAIRRRKGSVDYRLLLVLLPGYGRGRPSKYRTKSIVQTWGAAGLDSSPSLSASSSCMTLDRLIGQLPYVVRFHV
jgi:hypothetical protein